MDISNMGWFSSYLLHCNVRVRTVAYTPPWAGEPLHHHTRVGTSHHSRPLAILSDRARKVPHQIARQGSRGHRMVRLHVLEDVSCCVDV